jgi:hypothetical protein
MPFLITPEGSLSTKDTKPFEQNAYRVGLPTNLSIGQKLSTSKGPNDTKFKKR